MDSKSDPDWPELHALAHEGLAIHDAMADKWLDLLQSLVEGRLTTQEFNDQWMDYLRSLHGQATSSITTRER